MASVYGAFTLEPTSQEDFVANDGGSFSRPFFEEARGALLSLSSLTLRNDSSIYPPSYEEDAVQASRRENFQLSEWLIALLSLGKESLSPEKALLISLHAKSEGYYVDLRDGVILASFHRGFRVREFPGQPLEDEDTFLRSIGAVEEAPEAEPLAFDDSETPEDEEDILYTGIRIEKPTFEAKKKHRFVNLGGAPIASEEEDAAGEDEEEIPEIHVDRPSFEANRHGKMRNLDDPRPREAEEEEEDAPAAPISIERPYFEARSNKKPRNLNASSRREKKAAAPVSSTPSFDLEAARSSFTPVSSKKPRKLIREAPIRQKPAKEERKPEPLPEKEASISYESAPFEATPMSKPKEIKADPVHQAEKKGESAPVADLSSYQAEPSFRLHPKVVSGEESIVLSPKDARASKVLSTLQASLSPLSSLPLSKKAVFVPSVFPEDDAAWGILSRFDYASSLPLAATLNRDGDVLYAALLFEKEGTVVLVSFKHGRPHAVMLSHQGIDFDDPAQPYYAYPELKKAVGAK